MAVRNTWDLRNRVVESAQAILQREGAQGYFVTVKPGVWSTYTRYDRRRIQFGERLLLHSNSRRGYAHDRNLRGQPFYRDPWGRLGSLVLHECAHAVARQRNPRTRPHGREFYRVEAELLQRYLPALSSHLRTGNGGEFT